MISAYQPSRDLLVRLARHSFNTHIQLRFARTFCTDAGTTSRQSSLGLSDDQLEFKAVADDFAAKELLPFAAKWDATKHFPIDTFEKAAELGFGGILVASEFGKSTIAPAKPRNITTQQYHFSA